MKIFKKRSAKNAGGVVWRDAGGKIRCLGDNCPQANCNDTCPIWLSTMASTLHKMCETEAALAELKKASVIAPDFYDAWNNTLLISLCVYMCPRAVNRG